MRRHHLRHIPLGARGSGLEEGALVTGILLLVVGAVLALVHRDPGGLAWFFGTCGLAALGIRAISGGIRLYRAGVAVSLPRSVGTVGIRIHPRRLSTAATTVFALVLPAAAAGAFVALVDWGWLAIGGVLLIGSVALLVSGARDGAGDRPYVGPSDPPTDLLERLCMRADIPVPELAVEWHAVPDAWTTRGRIHLTTRLLTTLERSELEAVLAHELAHLAHRDAAVMDVCSGPSRVLLGFVGGLTSGLRVWARNIFDIGFPGVALWVAILAALSVPPALLFGWVSRLSVLRMSREREFAADAAAATLTGRPSALASALLKLDDATGRLPRADLRAVEGRAVLSILGTGRSALGPLFSTHPPTAARVKRLQAIGQSLAQ